MDAPDFSKLTSEILDAYGYTEARLGEVLGISQPTVWRIKVGLTSDPGFGVGTRIVAVHKKRPRTRKKRALA